MLSLLFFLQPSQLLVFSLCLALLLLFVCRRGHLHRFVSRKNMQKLIVGFAFVFFDLCVGAGKGGVLPQAHSPVARTQVDFAYPSKGSGMSVFGLVPTNKS